jgi:hypothetical protein
MTSTEVTLAPEDDRVTVPEELKVGSIDQILAAPDSQEKLIPVPEWSCAVRIHSLSKGQQLDLRRQATRKGVVDPSVLEMLIFIEGVAEPKFGREHYGQLLQKNSGPIDRILKEIVKLSGATEEDLAEAAAAFLTG